MREMSLARRLEPFVLGSLLLLTIASCAGSTYWTEPIPSAPAIDSGAFAEDVEWLAADAREGRGLGTAGLQAAAGYLAEGFREAGFEPFDGERSFFQSFEMPVSIRVQESELHLYNDPDGEPLERGDDFAALLSSESGTADSELVFAGYGISDKKSGYDDYQGLDVEGRLVLVLDALPAGESAGIEPARGAGFMNRAYKLLNARKRGAAGLLIAPSVEGLEGLPAGASSGGRIPTLSSSGILALAVSRQAAERLVASGGGDRLADLQKAIDESGRPASRVLPRTRVSAKVRIERREGTVVNVIARLPGADPELASEVVVIGAHYDHLGAGEYGALAPGRRGEVHNGADDNASGTAGLLALARAFGSGPRPRRSLILAAFTGEEAGLVGSARYVEAPPVPIEDTVAMVNLDMIGRPREGRVIAFGTESSPRFADLVAKAADGTGIQVQIERGASGPSDQLSFYEKGVPVLSFFTGVHAEYHTPDDDSDTIDATGSTGVLRLTYRTTAALLDTERRPALIRAATPRTRGAAGESYGPYLGMVPSFAGEPVVGVRLQAVRSGSPAEQGGLRGGDVIVSFGGAPVRNLEEFAALLRAQSAGRRVEIVFVRDGERIQTTATLGQRR
jgi:hypothetical protein